ncbi:sugar phosphate nucleotidyltransferase [Sphingomonas soli]|uniref:sugar phosphate nucleotidyltransferase n=1 Tax=Sphingomonas soli TaxID=266127 RepID=UPI0008370503|nr:sugar phosphate nucleotidyltransferase [Sphingomonas soli]
MEKRAIILAGGKGTRLRPYTTVLPKPLMPIGEYPILEVIIRQLVKAGFDRITLAVNHQAEIIKAYFASGERLDVKIDYSLEDQPLGTMGPLRLMADLPEHFLVMNGDVLTDLDFGGFYDRHVASDSVFSISAHLRQQIVDYGVLDRDADGHLSGFREKPKSDYLVSMGVYMASRRCLDLIPAGQLYGFDHLMLDLMQRGERVAVRDFSGYWLDIGRPDDYMKAIDEFDAKKDLFL